jgi:hypothetical protein
MDRGVEERPAAVVALHLIKRIRATAVAAAAAVLHIHGGDYELFGRIIKMRR